MVGWGGGTAIHKCTSTNAHKSSCIIPKQFGSTLSEKSKVAAHKNAGVSRDKVEGHTSTQGMFSSWLASGKQARARTGNQCQTPEQSSVAKDSCEYIRHASSWMSFQTQAGKLNSHSGPHGSNALEHYITVSCNSDFLSKKGKEATFDYELPKNEHNLETVGPRQQTQVKVLTDTSHMANRAVVKFQSLSPSPVT